ncbi:hypothetical protein BU15DRAFT_64411 [Melanogaster broomeanus]|nr:hypothetical protein BU15DRAFT_64411 [Melanogaster broomeanus]
MTPVGLLLSAFASTAAFALWKLICVVHHELTSPLRHLRGPKGTSFIYGSILDIFMAFVHEDSRLQQQWVKEYGKTLRYKGHSSGLRWRHLDKPVVHYGHQRLPEASYVRYGVAQILGEATDLGKFFLGTQRSGPAQIRALTGTFLSKAIRLRDVWSSEIANNARNTTGAQPRSFKLASTGA